MDAGDLTRAKDKVSASVQFCCPSCEAMFVHRLADLGDVGSCSRCSSRYGTITEPPPAGVPVDRCWFCGNEEFYIQKDFNRHLGFMIVVVSALLVFLVMLWTDHLTGVYVLLGIALVDWIVYRLVGNATVCYLCQSIYRGFPLNPAHTGFYLGDEEKYKKLRQDWLDRALGADSAESEDSRGAPSQKPDSKLGDRQRSRRETSTRTETTT